MEIKLRKEQNTLVVSGVGLVVLCLWDLLKMVIYVFFNNDELQKTFHEAMEELADLDDNDRQLVVNLFNIAFLLVIAVTIAVYFYVGISAYYEGIGKKHRNLYLVFILLLMYWKYSDLTSDIDSIANVKEFDNTLIPTLMIDVTAMLFLLDIFAAAIKIRILSKKIAAENV